MSDKYVPPFMRVPERRGGAQENDANAKGAFDRADLLSLTRSDDQDKYGGPTTFVAVPVHPPTLESPEALTDPRLYQACESWLRSIGAHLGPFVLASAETAKKVNAVQVPNYVKQAGTLFTAQEGVRRFQVSQDLNAWLSWFKAFGMSPQFNSETQTYPSGASLIDQRGENLKRERLAQIRQLLTAHRLSDHQQRFLDGATTDEKRQALASSESDLALQRVVAPAPRTPIVSADADHRTNFQGATLVQKMRTLRGMAERVANLEAEFATTLVQNLGFNPSVAAQAGRDAANITLLAMHRAFSEADAQVAGAYIMNGRVDPRFVVGRFEELLFPSLAQVLKEAQIGDAEYQPSFAEQAADAARALFGRLLSGIKAD